jgi:hypothetical protein
VDARRARRNRLRQRANVDEAQPARARRRDAWIVAKRRKRSAEKTQDPLSGFDLDHAAIDRHARHAMSRSNGHA